MITLTVEVDNNIVSFIATRHKNTKTYLSSLIKEDMLLNDINESKKSGINEFNSFDDLDN